MSPINLYAALLFIFPCVISKQTSNPFYVIGHMVNSEKAIDYVVKSGANAVEVDLWFHDDGTPKIFEHGGLCDCSCSPFSEICDNGLSKRCSGKAASNDAKDHLKKIAEQANKIALLYVDSKIDAKVGKVMNLAGSKVVPFIDEHLFKNGYRGDVIISGAFIDTYEYIRTAVVAAKSSPNKDRYFFSFGQEQGPQAFQEIQQMLSQMGTLNQGYGTGVTACVIINFESYVKEAVEGRAMGEVSFTYIWTIDKSSSMEMYINLGVEGVMTNNPERLAALANTLGLQLARPGVDHLHPSTSLISRTDDSCDCDYHRGGCSISKPAPPFRACKCKYVGAWTCRGETVSCDNSNTLCKIPDGSKASCQLGGGDCLVRTY